MRDGEMDCRNVRLHTLFVSGFIPDILNCGGEGGGCGGSSFIGGFTRRKRFTIAGACREVRSGVGWVIVYGWLIM